MRIISIIVYKCGGDEPVMLQSAYELGFVSIFQRGTLKEFINFHSRLVVSRTPVEERMEVALEKGVCYSYVSMDKIGVSFICDEEYPRRVAIDLIYKILENFNQHIYTNKINIQNITKDSDVKFKFVSTVISEWQNPNESKILFFILEDNILKLQNELNDVTNVMKKNLQELLKREESLETLMSKSKDLNSVSVEFYKKAKSANNKCCNLY